MIENVPPTLSGCASRADRCFALILNETTTKEGDPVWKQCRAIHAASVEVLLGDNAGALCAHRTM